MSKVIILLVVAVLGVGGFFVYRNMAKQNQPVNVPAPTASPSSQPTAQPSPSLSPIFSYLSKWVPGAEWDTPQKAVKDTPYGKLTGMESTGEITGEGASIRRNFEDEKVMKSLGYEGEDIKFAADGPGASNWGYSKTENGQTQVVTFSYSTNRLLGPESKSPPYVNLSVFVSNPLK